MKLSLAIDGFLLAKRVAGCSPHTIRNYKLTLRRLQHFLPADPHLAAVTADQVRAFLDHLMTAQFDHPGVAHRPPQRLSAKTIRNVHICLSSLWTWAIAEGYATIHVVRAVAAPTPEPALIVPFTRDQVQALLRSLTHSLPWASSPDTQTEIPRRRQLRDRAIILFLLDTGVRSSELCALRIADVDLVAGSARARSKGRLNTGQGKERPVRFGPSTARALWQYLAARDALDAKSEPLFATRSDRPLDRRTLAKHVHRLGERAGVPDCHPHRFRHTFAINYLRNGGDVFTLKDLLGHTSLDMVQRYLHIAQVDIENAHRRASPVEGWRL